MEILKNHENARSDVDVDEEASCNLEDLLSDFTVGCVHEHVDQLCGFL